MSDGKIKIDIEIDGKPVDTASKSLDGLEKSGGQAGKGVKQTEDGLKGVSEESTKAGGNIKKFATALGLVAIGAAAFKVLRASMDDAISRFDTLNQFPKVMEQVGFGAEESERAIRALADGIDGLPTKLDDVTSTAQQIAVMTGDLDGAVDTTLALNNAFMASGASAADAQRGLTQYIQMLAKGEVDLQSWRTLQETMGVALNDVADAFGYAGESAQHDLYAALQSGDVTFNEFNAKLVELSEETGGFADRAKTASSGIATSLSNLRYAVAIGIANMIASFSKLSEEVTGKDLAQNLDSLKVVVNASFKAMGNAIESATPYVIGFADAVGTVIPVVQALSPVLIGAATAYAMHAVIGKTVAALQASRAVTLTVTAAKSLYTIAVTKNSISLMANAASSKILAAARGVMSALTVAAIAAELLLTGQITLATAAKYASAVAAGVLGAALKFMMGPIGWVTLAIGALVGAVVGIVKWFNRTSEETQQLMNDTEDMAASMGELTDSVEDTSRIYENNIKSMEDSAKQTGQLAQEIDELSQKENKSAEEKAHLISIVEQLNGSVDGLNLAYGEEADMLNMTSEQLENRLELLGEQEKANIAQERMNQLREEESEILAKLEESTAMQKDLNEQIEEGGRGTRKLRDSRGELEEKEKELRIALSETKEEQKDVQETATEAQKAILEATEASVTGQKVLFEELSESQQATVESMKAAWEDYKDSATDMFDVLNDEIEITASEMANNLEENQRIIGEWADNIATLAERGVDEGLLNTLREAGPESAGHVNALVNASDEELQELSTAFAEGGNVATDALSKSLGIEESGVMEAVGHLVTDTEAALKSQINSADFEGVGGDLTDGLAGGIDGGSTNVQNAAENMADDTTKATKDAFGVRSPSTVFKDIGSYLMDGLEIGINDGASKVIQAIQKMFDSVQKDSESSFKTIVKNYDSSVKDIETALNRLVPITQIAMSNMLSRLRTGTSQQLSLLRVFSNAIVSTFNSTPSQFRSIGVNSMLGLNQGLLAGRGRVMATARNIANEITRTMQRAQRINSPAREMRDKVGKWIPEGIAEGIKDNAKSVYRELEAISNNMVKSSPEEAAGTARMAYSSGGYQSVNRFTGDNTNQTRERPVEQIIKIEASDVVMDGRKVGKVVWKPVKENIDRNTRVAEKFRG